jgi:ADP-ribose pyrophosphatase YjhB (NUDIX family)
LEQGEDPVSACAREALEETAHVFEPQHLVGLYLSRFQRPARAESPAQDITYLRLAFAGQLGAHDPHQPLDEGIERTLWMTLAEVRASADRHRSPLVLKCIEDHASGQLHPLQVLYTHPAVTER